MELKASSVYDEETIKAFTEISMFKTAGKKRRTGVLGALTGTVALLIIIDFIISGFSSFLLTMLLLLAFIVIMMTAMVILLPKMTYRALSAMKGVKNSFVFHDEGFLTVSEKEDFHGETEIKYEMLAKAYETKKYFFLYQTDNSAYIADKSTFDGDTNALSAKLFSALGDKFRICKW